MNFLRNNWQLIVGALVLGLVGYWIWGGFGSLLAGLAGAKRAAQAVADSKARTSETDARQAQKESQLEKQREETDKLQSEAEKIVDEKDKPKPPDTGSDLEDRFRRRNR